MVSGVLAFAIVSPTFAQATISVAALQTSVTTGADATQITTNVVTLYTAANTAGTVPALAGDIGAIAQAAILSPDPDVICAAGNMLDAFSQVAGNNFDDLAALRKRIGPNCTVIAAITPAPAANFTLSTPAVGGSDIAAITPPVVVPTPTPGPSVSVSAPAPVLEDRAL